MKRVAIAELKARLSQYLRAVRRGRPLLVVNRDTPVAKLLPVDPQAGRLEIRRPRRGVGRPQDVPLPPPLAIDRDIVDLLLEERQGSR